MSETDTFYIFFFTKYFIGWCTITKIIYRTTSGQHKTRRFGFIFRKFWWINGRLYTDTVPWFWICYICFVRCCKKCVDTKPTYTKGFYYNDAFWLYFFFFWWSITLLYLYATRMHCENYNIDLAFSMISCTL